MVDEKLFPVGYQGANEDELPAGGQGMAKAD